MSDPFNPDAPVNSGPSAPPIVILRGGGFQQNYVYEDFLRDCNTLYDYLATLRKTISQADLLDRFSALFIDGSDYPEPGILATLHRIVMSKWADIEFDNVLNRCCYILVNYWWSKSGLEQGTPHLVSLFDPRQLETTAGFGDFNPTYKLRTLVSQFAKTEQYAVLQDRARTVLHRPGAKPVSPVAESAQRIRDFIPRYPFLYSHLFMNWDTSAEGQYAIKRLQIQKECTYEQALHRYATGLLRGHRATGMAVLGAEGAIAPLDGLNPTLLTNQQLTTAIHHYAGKSEGTRTYQDTADHLWLDVKRAPSMQAAKWQLHDYLTGSISSKYGRHRFNSWLHERMQEVYPQYDTLRPSASLLTQTCVHLLDALLVSPRRLPENHLIFLDFNAHSGATLTMGFLLKIMLLCRSMTSRWEAMKSHVSKQFAILLKHYEASTHAELEWLIECLENLQVAFSIHSGRTDFSWVKLL
jgi:hypothetical protein